MIKNCISFYVKYALFLSDFDENFLGTFSSNVQISD